MPIRVGDGVLDVDIELCVLSSFYSSEQWKNGQRRNCFGEISYCVRDEIGDLYLLLSLDSASNGSDVKMYQSYLTE